VNEETRPTVKFYLLDRPLLGPNDNELNFLYVLAQAADLFGKDLTPEEMARVAWWFYARFGNASATKESP